MTKKKTDTIDYDVVIVGGGPAALSAAIYAGRAELKTLVLERAFLGGQVALTWEVDNYPGFPEGIEGPELIGLMEEQAKRFNTEFRTETVERIFLEDDMKMVATSKHTYRTPTLILAMGADPRELEVPGEHELRGKGVSYCGTCDAPFFRDKKVVVVGGGDAALKEALFITKFAAEVVLVHRRTEFRAEKIYQSEVRNHPKIALELNKTVKSINGADHVENVVLSDVETGVEETLSCDGAFIFVGNTPNTEFLCNVFPLDCGRHLNTDLNMMTAVPGIYAIGDVRKYSYRQIATAVGEGATAAIAAEHYITERRKK